MTKTTKWSEIRDARLSGPEHKAAYARARAAPDGELVAHRQTLGALRQPNSLTQSQLGEDTGRESGADVAHRAPGRPVPVHLAELPDAHWEQSLS